MINPIYRPSGRAGEYGELAVNIYTGCNHGCIYCYAPKILRKLWKDFMAVRPRQHIAEAVKRQLDREQITGKMIHLSFLCDPYPAKIDTTPTREVIKAIKTAGNHVQILTKGGERAERDFDLLDNEDKFGVTLTVAKSNRLEQFAASTNERFISLIKAHMLGIQTWISCEPVYDPDFVYQLITDYDFIDEYKIGMLNYSHSKIDWAVFGRECERLCKENGRNYYIKQDLRAKMEAGGK